MSIFITEKEWTVVDPRRQNYRVLLNEVIMSQLYA